jgi:site-specific DNA recombinase
MTANKKKQKLTPEADSTRNDAGPTDGNSTVRAATAVIYLRVSTAAQADKDYDEEGFSIPAQREACYRKAEALGATVVDEYLDRGESAKTADRPALKRMLTRIMTERDVDLVIVHKVDRLARSREDDVAIGMTIRRAGAVLVSVSENVDATPSGKLLHAIMSGMAEFYSDNLATEALKGMTSKAKKGGTPGRAPIGYRNTAAVVDGREIRTVTVDPERAPHVQWAFETYATGQWTIRQLTEELERRGLVSVPIGRKPAKPMHMSRVASMLTNPYYTGIVRFRGVEYPGRHEPLITNKLFEQVQQISAGRHVAAELQRRHLHYLKGTVWCGECGSRLVFSRNKGHGGTYDYFVCLGRHQKRTQCSLRYLSVHAIETAVENHYATVQLEPGRITELQEQLRSAMATARTEADHVIASQTRRLARLRDERRKLLQAHYADAIDVSLLKEEQDRIRRQEQETLALLDAAQVELPTLEATIEAAIRLVERCQDAYLGAGPKLRRQFNQAFFKKLYITRDDGVIRAELTEAYAALLEHDVLRHVADHLDAHPETTPRRTRRTKSDAWWQSFLDGEDDTAGSKLRPVRDRGSKANCLVPSAGFEPAAHGLGNRCSIP